MNKNRKAGGTTSVDKKLRKALEQIETLRQQNSQTSMSVLNMRQMFESVTQEKMALQQQLNNVQQMLTALVSQSRGKTVTIKAKTLENVTKFAGVDTKAVDGDLQITALTVEQVQEMQDDIDEDQEESNE